MHTRLTSWIFTKFSRTFIPQRLSYLGGILRSPPSHHPHCSCRLNCLSRASTALPNIFPHHLKAQTWLYVHKCKRNVAASSAADRHDSPETPLKIYSHSCLLGRLCRARAPPWTKSWWLLFYANWMGVRCVFRFLQLFDHWRKDSSANIDHFTEQRAITCYLRLCIWLWIVRLGEEKISYFHRSLSTIYQINGHIYREFMKPKSLPISEKKKILLIWIRRRCLRKIKWWR